MLIVYHQTVFYTPGIRKGKDRKVCNSEGASIIGQGEKQISKHTHSHPQVVNSMSKLKYSDEIEIN